MEVFLAACIVFAASYVQGIVGFGSGMIAMALLPYIFELRFAVAVVSVLGLFLSSTLVYQHRHALDPKRYRPLLLGGLVGIPIGVLFLMGGDPRAVRSTLGVVIILYALGSLLPTRRILGIEDQTDIPGGDRWGYVAGLVGGALGGAFNTGGPPAVIYGSMRPWSHIEFAATLQIFFLLTSVIQLVAFTWTGMITIEILQVDAVLVPVTMIGGALGARVAHRLNRDLARKMVLGLLLVLGCVFLYKAIAP
jgi:uncharacterized protein